MRWSFSAKIKKRPSMAALFNTGHPAAIDNEADPAKPGHACRIGGEAADSRHLRVPNIALSYAATG
jgi:hypothetical protein